MKNFCVAPISLLSDICNVDYPVQMAVLATKCEYVQHTYTKQEKNEIWCLKP